MPFAFVLAVGVFAVLGLLIRSLDEADIAVAGARKAYWAALVATGLIYLVYLGQGEAWLWY